METSHGTDRVNIKDEMSRHDLLNSPRLQTLVLDKLRSEAEERPDAAIHFELIVRPQLEE